MATIKDLTKECKTVIDFKLGGPVVTYKGVPLWMTMYQEQPTEIEGCEILLIEETEDLGDGEVYTQFYILGWTPVVGMGPSVRDHSTYGRWETLEEAQAWLENPVPLY